MHCACGGSAIFLHPPLCREHFLTYFEEKVKCTITEFSLLRKGDRVVVAASGGKDSMTVLHLLRTLGYEPAALAVDEGIAGYRDSTLEDLREFCSREGIPLKIVSFKEEFGKSLDTMLAEKGWRPCSACGTFRRHLLNKHARGFEVIATGHNADDEAQSVLMNLTRANVDLFPRGGPMTTSNASGFVRKVKPLYFCTEKEVTLYAFLQGLRSEFTECPNAAIALRAGIRDLLNEYEAKHPGTKVNILRRYLKVKASLSPQESSTLPCSRCGEPCSGDICKACRLREAIAS